MAKRKKQLRKRVKKSNLKKFFLFGFVLITIILGYFIFNLQSNKLKIAETENKKSLQLGTFQPTNKPLATRPPIRKLATSTPTPAPNVKPQCNHDNGKKITDPDCGCYAWRVTCKDLQCVSVKPDLYSCDGLNQDFTNICAPPYANEGDGEYCLGKPIIYLYPEIPTFVDVRIETIGNIFVSDPHYPDGGWKNVLAYPNGNLLYQGKQYRELFYETDVDDFEKPTNGINIPKENVEAELLIILAKLGLNEFERKEFTDFWAPILENQEKPYIQFSLIQGVAKDEIDKVVINPKPDTFIEILAYFKPLDTPFQGPRLKLPPTPTRIGFTAVEWGAVLDNKP